MKKSLWHDIIKAKYLKGGGISSVPHRINDSHVWTDLLKIRQGKKIITKNGKQTLFLKDEWPNCKPICIAAPILYDWCSQKNMTVNKFLSMEGQIRFDRWLPPILLAVGGHNKSSPL
jgi:hypothetical protein